MDARIDVDLYERPHRCDSADGHGAVNSMDDHDVVLPNDGDCVVDPRDYYDVVAVGIGCRHMPLSYCLYIVCLSTYNTRHARCYPESVIKTF